MRAKAHVTYLEQEMLPVVHQNGNRSVFFSELIGLEVWSSAKNDGNIYSFHVDIAFKKGRLGGDSDCGVTFDLTLKAAELVVVVPETEPLEVLSNFTTRYGLPSEVTRKSVFKRADGAEATLSAARSFGLDTLKLTTQSNAAVSARHTLEQEIEIFEKTGAIAVHHSPSGNGSNTWSFESIANDHLIGKPWDAVREPRLSVRNCASSGGASLAPCISVSVRCKKEDLIIKNIQVDDQPIGVFARMFGNNHQLAAESYIRNKLAAMGLPMGVSQNRYSEVNLAMHIYDSWS